MFRALGLTGEQIRAARALARIDQAELAARSDLSLETIKRLERTRGAVAANLRTFTAIQRAFVELGVVFETGEAGTVGVRTIHQPDLRQVRAPGLRPPAQTDASAPKLHRLIYHSRVAPTFAGEMAAVLHDIHDVAIRRNAELDITSALLACDGRFLQALEGERDAVLRVYGGISVDRRHKDLQILDSRTINYRQFPNCSFCCSELDAQDPAITGEPALADGFRPEALSPASALGLLGHVRCMDEPVPDLEDRTRKSASS